MSHKIFVIKNNYGITGFYDNLEKAKNELKKIFKQTVDFKHYKYEINVYELVENEYLIYTYEFDQFLITN